LFSSKCAINAAYEHFSVDIESKCLTCALVTVIGLSVNVNVSITHHCDLCPRVHEEQEFKWHPCSQTPNY